jgi:hypothetical protein
MADPNPQLTAVLQTLATAIAALAANNAAPAAPAAAATGYLDPIHEDAPFDLSSRSGATAYARVCTKLDESWDGDVSKFAGFVIALQLRARDANWDAPSPFGILQIEDPNDATKSYHLFSEYHRLTEPAIAQAAAARTDIRAKQNATALYRTLRLSLEGSVKSTMLHQTGNLQANEDGVAFFFRLTQLTAVASLQLSMLSWKKIMEFDPTEFQFNIPVINTQLNELFIMAATVQRPLDEYARVEYILQVYDRIKRPEQWVQWVQTQFNLIRSGVGIHNSQAFMNTATITYSEITQRQQGKFNGSTVTMQGEIENIVALIAKKNTRSTTATAAAVAGGSNSDSSEDSTTRQRAPKPPFSRHFKHSKEPGATPYNNGDTKVWNGTTYHFCDYPSHRDRLHWHPFPADQCRTRTAWLAKGGNRPVAHAADATPDAPTNPTPAATPSPAPNPGPVPDNVSALLASALSLLSHSNSDDLTKDLIADALNSLRN